LKNTVYYPFHPLHGQEVSVACRGRRQDDPVTVIDPQGVQLKVPAWMLLPDAARHGLSREAVISGTAWLRLCDLLGIEATHDVVAGASVARGGDGPERPADHRV
jgi:hypothetical protein